ncbi:mismatch-specific DNA-glycosylase [Paenibacillus taiwanensis]|uniref:mismatch-specific DNA-glycosylase n=1 Tax=Paenibacillus taiwanensis TaxID=401638 RepID=UPI0003FC5990|nr:mismatch-specific DNA-glycosylase [Paenibacillus taiwanensis]
MLSEIADHIQPGLKVLFVGFNPSLRSGETGHHYANPRNRFWTILYRSGLTERLYHAAEDQDLLALGYGFTNIVSRPTRTAAEISTAEYAEGRIKLLHKITLSQPQVVCFVGKGVYKAFSGKDAVWGYQAEPIVEGTLVFVAPSSSGLVRMKLEEVIDIYRRLAIGLTRPDR